MFCMLKNIYSAYGKGRKAKSKKRRWHYLAVNTLSTLLRGLT